MKKSTVMSNNDDHTNGKDPDIKDHWQWTNNEEEDVAPVTHEDPMAVVQPIGKYANKNDISCKAKYIRKDGG
eukprot:6092450-Ditylum_brightwellii.AAC.1